jgi:hypothetical protein
MFATTSRQVVLACSLFFALYASPAAAQSAHPRAPQGSHARSPHARAAQARAASGDRAEWTELERTSPARGWSHRASRGWLPALRVRPLRSVSELASATDQSARRAVDPRSDEERREERDDRAAAPAPRWIDRLVTSPASPCPPEPGGGSTCGSATTVAIVELP